MISYIKGELASVGEDQIIVEVHGIGYGIFMPGQAMTMLPPVGNEVKIHTESVPSSDRGQWDRTKRRSEYFVKDDAR